MKINVKYFGFDGVCKFFNLKWKETELALSEKEISKYISFNIPKSDGTYRTIEKPPENTKTIQLIIKNKLEQIYSPPSTTMGFVKGKSIKTNAEKHQKRKCIIHFDIKDFFPSITTRRIVGLSRKVFGFDYKASLYFSKLVTYKGRLPQGSPCSPILANMIYLRMDRDIEKYIYRLPIFYTRYADDMIFSIHNQDSLLISKLIIKDNLNKVLANPDFERLIFKNGFSLNDRKPNIKEFPSSLRITGLVVNQKVNVSKNYLKQMRFDLHVMKKFKDGNIKQILGKVSYFRFIRGKSDLLACKYCHLLNNLGQSYFPDADFIFNKEEATCKYVGRITTLEGELGTCFFVKGFIVTPFHVVESIKTSLPFVFKISFFDNGRITEEHDVKIVDAYYYNEMAILKPKDYFSFANRELRLSNCGLLTTPFNVYIAGFTHLEIKCHQMIPLRNFSEKLTKKAGF